MSASTRRRLKVGVALGGAGLSLILLVLSLVGSHVVGCGGGGSSPGNCGTICGQARKCMIAVGSSFSASRTGLEWSWSTSVTPSGPATCEDACQQTMLLSGSSAEPALVQLTADCASRAGDDCSAVYKCFYTSGSW